MYVAFSLTPCPGLNLNPTTTCYHVLVESRPTHFTFFFLSSFAMCWSRNILPTLPERIAIWETEGSRLFRPVDVSDSILRCSDVSNVEPLTSLWRRLLAIANNRYCRDGEARSVFLSVPVIKINIKIKKKYSRDMCRSSQCVDVFFTNEIVSARWRFTVCHFLINLCCVCEREICMMFLLFLSSASVVTSYLVLVSATLYKDN